MIILMGLAGAGKGTQAKMLVDKNGYHLISTGEILRKYATEDQKQRMLDGILLNDDEIFQIISQALKEVPDLQKCILDGTPRSVPQAKWLLDQVADNHFKITAVIHLDIDEEVVRHRLVDRGREDDTDTGIAKRFAEYRNSTLPILDYLKENGISVYNVNGDQSPESVHQDIVDILEGK